MSAITEEPDGFKAEPLKVLIALQDGFDLCDMAGPMEVFSWAQHNAKDEGTSLEMPPPPSLKTIMLTSLSPQNPKLSASSWPARPSPSPLTKA